MSSDCIEWQGRINENGYGRIAGKLAHRVIYERAKGPIPDGTVLDHLCRNRRCTNPDHLEPVTFAENVARGSRASQTHCKNGHEFTVENTYYRPTGTGRSRTCRACNRESVRRYQEKRSA